MHAIMYRVPAESVQTELIVKKSRFIARAANAGSRDAAMSFLSRTRDDFPDASHHCWAYLLGTPRNPRAMSMSDDGEPSGTAGKPIANVLTYKSIGDVVVVVTRYFGGIKLGAGGLVRAYSSATQKVIDVLPTAPLVQRLSFEVVISYATEQKLRHWLEIHAGEIIDVDYADEVVVRCMLPAEVVESLHDQAAALAWRVSPVPD